MFLFLVSACAYAYDYVALVSSENGDVISTSISTRHKAVNYDRRQPAMTALSLDALNCACVCLYACAYALVKTSLNRGVFYGRLKSGFVCCWDHA